MFIMLLDFEFDGVLLLIEVKKLWVFMVGVGGIGCELFKNFVLIGFGEMYIVDFDIIDFSNLN